MRISFRPANTVFNFRFSVSGSLREQHNPVTIIVHCSPNRTWYDSLPLISSIRQCFCKEANGTFVSGLFASFCHSEGTKRPKNLKPLAALRMTREKELFVEGFFGFRRSFGTLLEACRTLLAPYYCCHGSSPALVPEISGLAWKGMF